MLISGHAQKVAPLHTVERIAHPVWKTISCRGVLLAFQKCALIYPINHAVVRDIDARPTQRRNGQFPPNRRQRYDGKRLRLAATLVLSPLAPNRCSCVSCVNSARLPTANSSFRCIGLEKHDVSNITVCGWIDIRPIANNCGSHPGAAFRAI